MQERDFYVVDNLVFNFRSSHFSFGTCNFPPCFHGPKAKGKRTCKKLKRLHVVCCCCERKSNAFIWMYKQNPHFFTPTGKIAGGRRSPPTGTLHEAEAGTPVPPDGQRYARHRAKKHQRAGKGVPPGLLTSPSVHAWSSPRQIFTLPGAGVGLVLTALAAAAQRYTCRPRPGLPPRLLPARAILRAQGRSPGHEGSPPDATAS